MSIKDNIDILDYTSFFHDGSIIDIDHQKDQVLIYMESAEVDKGDLEDNIELSEESCIKGILKIRQIKNIQLDQKPIENLKMLGDCGSILDFEITESTIKLFVEWINFPPNKEIEIYSTIYLEAKEIKWENNPNLFDPLR